VSAGDSLLPFAGQLFCRVDLDGEYGEGDNERVITSSVDGATLVTSYVDAPGEQLHRPIVDLDLPAALVPSSTPGHFHLYIDKPMSWAKYAALLEAFEAAGLIETGYLFASLERGHTAVRLPWIKKEITP